LSPGSQVVADYLREAKLLEDYAALGFDLAGFGCMTCIGNSGSLEPHVENFAEQGLKGVAILSGNRNFEGRVNPKVPAGYLASPALVVAYAIAGDIHVDLVNQPLAQDRNGRDVYLSELMPNDEDVAELAMRVVRPEFFAERLKTVWDGTHHWQALSAAGSVQFPWDPASTYLRRPRYLESIEAEPPKALAIDKARVLMVLGDNVTTDHISPAGSIPRESLAGKWLIAQGEDPVDLNQYSTRRSNHEVMLRGAFTNRSVRNLLLDEQPGLGAWALTADGKQVLPVYEASASYLAQGMPLVVFGGINYGAGSSRDWAAKAQALLGVRVVVARSFERIHRSNLIGMGILPLTFVESSSAQDLSLEGHEQLTFEGLEHLAVGVNNVTMRIERAGKEDQRVDVQLKLDSRQELIYLSHGGILPYVVRKMLGRSENRNCA
jgi:aconitate hydratase